MQMSNSSIIPVSGTKERMSHESMWCILSLLWYMLFLLVGETVRSLTTSVKEHKYAISY